jgi:FKBP-type peptidyl-prolyl cis-trans isomerase 2
MSIKEMAERKHPADERCRLSLGMIDVGLQHAYIEGATDVLKEIEKHLKHLDYGIKAKCTVTTENAYDNLMKKIKELKGTSSKSENKLYII